MLPTINAYSEIQYSTDPTNSTWYHLAYTNNNYFTVEELGNIGGGIDENTKVSFRVKHIYSSGESNWTYYNGFTKESGEIGMSSLSIAIFIILITGALFIVPSMRRFVNNPYMDLIIKRCMYIVGFFLLSLDSAIMATIASNSNIPLTSEMFMFMNIFGWAGYAAMIFVFFMTIVNLINMHKDLLRRKKEGEFDGDD